MNLLDNNLERKLTRVYVALELTRNVAQRGLGSEITGSSARSLMSLLDVAADLLEDALESGPSLPIQSSSESTELEMLM